MGFLQLKTIFSAENIPSKDTIIVGIDEAGRGPIAGPVVACALTLRNGGNIKGVKDSKQLSAQKREELYHQIVRTSEYGVGVTEAKEIDKLGIIKATNLSFSRAVENLEAKLFPNNKKQSAKNKCSIFLLIDGRDRLSLKHPFKTIIKGDSKVKEIACASIIAKVKRDKIMTENANRFPGYGFEEHKGYGTKVHINAIREKGVCTEHRKTYEPVYTILNQNSLF